jgi:hypothetical protein
VAWRFAHHHTAVLRHRLACAHLALAAAARQRARLRGALDSEREARAQAELDLAAALEYVQALLDGELAQAAASERSAVTERDAARAKLQRAVEERDAAAAEGAAAAQEVALLRHALQEAQERQQMQQQPLPRALVPGPVTRTALLALL